MKKVSLGAKPLVFPVPVWCIGTYDKDGKPNVMTVAWGGICSSVPPCVAISLQKIRYTYESLKAQKAFTVNVPSEKYAAEADYFGMVSGKRIDKFSETGLTPVKSSLVNAPYIEEFPMVLECRMIHSYEIGIHTQFIGEILDVKVNSNVVDADGLPDIEKVRPIVFGPEVRSYHSVGDFIGKAFSIGKRS